MITRSIRRFLLINLLLSITITSSLTAVGTYLLDNKAIQRHLDIQLQQVTIFLNSVIAEKINVSSMKNIQKILNQKTTISNKKENKNIALNNQFRFQVWDNNNKLVLYSIPPLFNERLATIKNGFGNFIFKNQTFRVYSSYDPSLQLTFIVAEPFDFRAQLEQEITWDNLLILFWIYPLLGLLIWITVGAALTSLKKTANKLALKPVTDFSPIDSTNVPTEVAPLINELNQLFMRLQEEFERNKRFASDAAHELRTPLAALKTQTQVALLANNIEEKKKNILKNLLLGVDRCTHVVHQLLTLSRLGQQAALNDIKTINLRSVAAEMIAQLAPMALEKDIDIELKKSKENITLAGNETMLSILIRNLVDNAIRYTPKHGNVSVEILKIDQRAVLRVSDSGPGIPFELQSRVFERFYRILGTNTSGSGLGLAIVQQIAELHQAQIKLGTPENGQGLQIDIIFPEILSS